LDAEAFTMEALAKAWQEDRNPAWREHVTPYIYFNPKVFNIRILEHKEDLSHLRWTVDTREDLKLMRQIYSLMDRDHFSWLEVLDLVRRHPDLNQINAHVKQKRVTTAED
jgi:spore coat polysaccharide biosynthesis protein SpsF